MTWVYSRAGMLGSSGLILVLLATGAVATGQDRPGAVPKADEPRRMLFGVQYCAPCHNDTGGVYKSERVICRMNESKTWATQDKHKNALAVLAGERGQQMGKLLGIKDVTTDRSCVSCHGISDRIDVAMPGGQAIEIPKQQFDPKFDGVTCVACHGPFREWVIEHSLFQDPKWRALSRQEKETRFGMVDLWDPVTRAKVCVSCHIGNVEQGKVLTHSMYAAGHPPLPGIEVFTFSEAMPNHWEYLNEKRKGRLPEVVQTLEATHDLDKLEHTELVAVSGLVALRESLRLLTDQAKAGEVRGLPGSRWPDFARFDCFACHHDVNRSSWRQARSFAGVPGRPPAPSWPAALVEVGVAAANPAQAQERLSEYDRKLQAFHQAISAQPFGAKDRAVAAADDLARWTDRVLDDLARTKLDTKAALALLPPICKAAQRDLPDYDTARQLYWAFRTISTEYEQRTGVKSQVPQLLDELGRELGLNLPSAGKQEPIEQTLFARLKAVADYDPARFQSRFKELEKSLPRR